LKLKIGNLKQIIISIVLIGVVAGATVSPHVANIHLALTLFLGALHIYLGYQLSEKKVKPTNDLPASYAYIGAFASNAVISIAFNWWFSGIVWAYILCIYVAANQPQKKKMTEQE